jgi:sugar phosphate isomerase/epimerase
MLLPGVINAGQSAEAAVGAASAALRAMVTLAGDACIRVAVEPHVGALAATPEAVLDLVARVPGLGIVLDPAHFVCQGYDQAALAPLLAFAAHIHLRQARPGRLQAPHDAGTIDFDRLIADLHSVGYGGSLAIEYVHQPWMDTLHEDVLTETVRMRDLVRAWGNA